MQTIVLIRKSDTGNSDQSRPLYSTAEARQVLDEWDASPLTAHANGEVAKKGGVTSKGSKAARKRK
jgi:hypothetical protein